MLIAKLALAVPALPADVAAIDPCPRPPAGSAIPVPRDLHAVDGKLELDLAIVNAKETDGTIRFCYRLADGSESPTLRLHPGDWLILRLSNHLKNLSADSPDVIAAHSHGRSGDPCQSGEMSLISTNLHFHGLSIPAVCHQDEVLKTSIAPGSAPFEYRFQIPRDEPPGLYWYHPHIHGFSLRQVQSGRLRRDHR